MSALSEHPDLTTCDWTDEFCDCRDLGTIHCLVTEEDLCARHYWKRRAEMLTDDTFAGLKKPAASASLTLARREVKKS